MIGFAQCRRACLAALVATVALSASIRAQTAVPGAGEAPAESRGAAFGDLIAVQDIARIEGQGASVLRGMGIVTGLRGTGDSGADLALARPLARVYESNENSLADLKELSKAKASALVFLEVNIPPSGARRDDELDVYVTVSHSASSLAGGRLLISALAGPFPGDPVFAMAAGAIILEDTAVPTAGVVRHGAKMINDVRMRMPTEAFTLVLMPQYRHFTVTDQLADTINSLTLEPDPTDSNANAVPPMAWAIDNVSVGVQIPIVERANPAKFIARIMSATFSPTLLRQPAEVRLNPRLGTVIATANVEISAVAISQKDLVITTTTPPPVGTPGNPLQMRTRWSGVQTTGRASEKAKLADLLTAFKQLDVPIDAQMGILTEIHRTGRLHANLVVE